MINGVRASSIRMESTSSTMRTRGSLHLVVTGDGHVVAEVVEPELVVGAVGDAGGVGARLASCRRSRDQVPPRAEERYSSPSFGVALRQVVVDSDEVQAAPESAFR